MMTRWRLAWWWLRGELVCLDPHWCGTGFCKRRRHHLGMHKTGNRELVWRKK